MTTSAIPGSESSRRYWAFISYSHHDQEWARWLHTALETYRIPRGLVRPDAADDSGLSSDRIYPVFLDRDELSGGFDLDERIRTALGQSQFLIVVCSPDAVASRHVEQEIDVFEGLGHEDRVLCLIVDGEPGASSRPESGLRECLPVPVRTKRTPEGELVPCEPIAADARKGKDGRTNAKLKILAEMLGVPFDALKQRDERRRFRRRLTMAAATAGVSLLASAGYLLALDGGANAPGGASTRRVADRYGWSILRRLPPESLVQQQAAALRSRLSRRLMAARRGEWFVSRPAAWRYNSVWAHSQIVFSLLNVPDGEATGLQDLAQALEHPFASELKVERPGANYGWLARPGELAPLSIPAIWTSMSLAVALRRDAYPTAATRARALEHLAYVQDALAHYQPRDNPGWNLFPNQKVSGQHNVYASTLALMSLLEAKRASLPWQGSIEQRDRLIRQTFDWLVAQFDRSGNPPGWKARDDGVDVTSDGLSLQIYGRLLDARSEAGLTIPPAIVQEIPRHLAGIAGRAFADGSDSGEFYLPVSFDANEEFIARESISFLWYPWAIDCAVRWLRSEDASTAATEDRVAVERALSYLIVTLGNQAATKAVEMQTTFDAAETLYGLSAVAPVQIGKN